MIEDVFSVYIHYYKIQNYNNLFESLFYFLKSNKDFFDIRLIVVQIEANAGGGGDRERVHEGLATMVTGSDGDIFGIENLSDVMRMSVVESERNDSGVFFRIFRAKEG